MIFGPKAYILYLLAPLVCLISCKEQTAEKSSQGPIEGGPLSSIEQLYNLASNKNEQCIDMADSLLNSSYEPTTRAEVFFAKGLYYSNIDDREKAIECFDSTIALNFTMVDAYIEKSILLCKQKKYDAASATLKIALPITKNNADLYYWLGQSYEGQGKIQEASKLYEMTVNLDPDFEAAKEALKRIK